MVTDLNNREMNERFGAIIIAAQNGHIDIARQIFDLSLEFAVADALDQAIDLLRQAGNTSSCEIIRLLKEKDGNVIR